MGSRRTGTALAAALLATLASASGVPTAASASPASPAPPVPSVSLVTASERLVARTPQGWIGFQDRWIIEHSAGSSRRLLRVSGEGAEPPSVVGNGERTLVYYDGRLLLVTDGGRTIRALYSAAEPLSGMSLTAETVRWKAGNDSFRLTQDDGPVVRVG